MAAIAKNRDGTGPDGRSSPTLDALAARIGEALAAHRADPAHATVLLPFAQLVPAVREAWVRLHPQGFAPRMLTTQQWARERGAPPADAHGIVFDLARDLLTAQRLLAGAGLAAEQRALAPALVELAQPLARRIAAVPPDARADWAVAARASAALAPAGSAFAREAALARIALEWALAGSYPTDILFDDAGCQLLVVVDGAQPDALAHALGSCRAHAVLPLQPPGATGQVGWHACADADDEAERAAACVLAHVQAGRVPVALAATDRGLTRRIRALLAARGVLLRDESGWKLSTTRAAAAVVAVLRAAAFDAAADTVLDALKHAPSIDAAVLRQAEQALRRDPVGRWADWRPAPDLLGFRESVDTWRAALQPARRLADWPAALRAALHALGLWTALEADDAGRQLIAALSLDEGAGDWMAAGGRMPLAAFGAWAQAVLEAASFVPPAPDEDAEVVLLPLAQLLLRPFAAAVLPGSDAQRLPASPEPPGPWTAAQRAALGLPDRALLQAAAAAAWSHALAVPRVDVLWRSHDGAGEALSPSPLVQRARAAGIGADAADPRATVAIAPAPTLPDAADGAPLPVQRLSASAYDDLRRCPWRYFALRQLGLRDSEELDDTVDKRDFGQWLHAVLEHFHSQPAPEHAQAEAALDAAAAAATAQMALPPDAFLPYAASWPALRRGYAAWWAERQAAGATVAETEGWREAPLPDFAAHPLALVGQVDRIDRIAGATEVIDYKTEAPDRSAERVKHPDEDTQLAFYAVLVPGAAGAAYVNLSEKGTRGFAHPDLPAGRDAVLAGVQADLARVAAGAPLWPLGAGSACEHCDARGLCRKDFHPQ